MDTGSIRQALAHQIRPPHFSPSCDRWSADDYSAHIHGLRWRKALLTLRIWDQAFLRCSARIKSACESSLVRLRILSNGHFVISAAFGQQTQPPVRIVASYQTKRIESTSKSMDIRELGSRCVVLVATVCFVRTRNLGVSHKPVKSY